MSHTTSIVCLPLYDGRGPGVLRYQTHVSKGWGHGTFCLPHVDANRNHEASVDSFYRLV